MIRRNNGMGDLRPRKAKKKPPLLSNGDEKKEQKKLGFQRRENEGPLLLFLLVL